MTRNLNASAVLQRVAVWVFLPAGLAVCAPAAEPSKGADWPQWRGGPQRSGAACESALLTSLAAGAPLIEAWRSEELPNGYGHQAACVVGQGSPVVADGAVYLYVNWPDPASVGMVNNCRIPSRVQDTVLCLDLVSGATRWKSSLPGRAWRWGCSATLAVGGGKVLAVGSLGEAFCLDAATGREVWRWRNPATKRPDQESYTDVIGNAQGSALIGQDLAAFVDPVGQLVVCALADGTVRWTVGTGNKRLWSSPCLWGRAGAEVLLVGGTAYDLASGTRRWVLPGYGWSTPAIAGDVCAVMGSGKGLLISRLSATGPTTIADLPLDNASGNAAVADGRVYACGQRGGGEKADGSKEPSIGVVLCVEAATGQVLWETSDPAMRMGGGQWSFTSVVVAGQTVAVLVDRNLWLFNARDGKRLRDALSVDNLKGGTSLAIVGDRLITRGTKAVVCYQAGAKP